MTHLIGLKNTEDVGVSEVDDFVFEGVCRIEQSLTFSVEFDGVGGFIDAVGGDKNGFFELFLGPHSHILFVHVLDVVDSLFGDL